MNSRNTPEVLNAALNDARLDLVLSHNIAYFFKDGTVTFSGGVATAPSDYLRTIKELDAERNDRDLWLSNVNFLKVSYQRFGDSDIAREENIWTQKYDPDTDTEQFYTNPTTSGTYNIRYVRRPTNMSADGNKSQLPPQLEMLLPKMAAKIILEDDRKYTDASQMENQVDKSKHDHLQKSNEDQGSHKDSIAEKALLGTSIIM